MRKHSTLVCRTVYAKVSENIYEWGKNVGIVNPLRGLTFVLLILEIPRKV